ncbi:MAG TPA: molybdopterin-dependent oxidoreductase [Iamia sp.]|nr:molybdopterin-dependent oxidoreductase [Iamia sp.]
MTRGARTTLAGLLAVAAALATTELVNLLTPTRPSLLLGVQVWFIETFSASLKDLAVQLFGTQDKAALEIGAFLVALAFGPLTSRLEVRRRGAGAAMIGAFGVLGVLATLRHPQASGAVTVLAGLLGAAVGIATLWLLLDRFGLRVAPGAERLFRDRRPAASPPTDDPYGGAAVGQVAGTRREVILWGLGAGAAVATAGALAKGVGDASREAQAVIPDSIPAPAAPASLPAAPPFETPGLSPYIVRNEDFYLIDTSPQPPYVVTDQWTLKITGMVDTELSFSYEDLLARDLVEEVVTLSCVSNEVGGNLVGNARWTGIPLRTLLEEAGVQAGATQLVGEAVDGFTAGFPTSALDDLERTALVAVGMNGQPLPRAHGFPARLVVSGLYGYVSATKWLSEIRLTTLDDEDGYWISRGWAKEAPVKTQSRIDVPRNRANVMAGLVPIAGVAWAPSRGIQKVEVRIDGDDWMEADLGRVASDDTWVQWHVGWQAEAGDHEIQVRATDGDGETQGEDPVAPIPDGAEGWHTRQVRVAEA